MTGSVGRLGEYPKLTEHPNQLLDKANTQADLPADGLKCSEKVWHIPHQEEQSDGTDKSDADYI